jgi:Sec-independent protein translocase protein TatA
MLFSFLLFYLINLSTFLVPLYMLIIFIEAVWWSGLLLLMLLLFLFEYNRFVQAAVDLEEANRRLRLETNGLFQQMREKSRASRGQGDSVVHPQEESMTMKEQDKHGEHVREEA